MIALTAIIAMHERDNRRREIDRLQGKWKEIDPTKQRLFRKRGDNETDS
jgi:hypothetical protein